MNENYYGSLLAGGSGGSGGASGGAPILEGTEENPIILEELDYGHYYIKGYYKYFAINDNALPIIGYGGIDLTQVVYIRVYKSTSELKKITAYGVKLNQHTSYGFGYYAESGATWIKRMNAQYSFSVDENDSMVDVTYSSATYIYFESFAANSALRTYQGTNNSANHSNQYVYGLSTNNTIEYTPTADYHPATFKFVKDTVAAAAPIKVLDDPTDTSDLSLLNCLAVSSDVTDESLYFYKQVGTQIVDVELLADQIYDDVYFYKTIIERTGYGYGGTKSLAFALYDASGKLLSNCYIYVYFDSGAVTGIREATRNAVDLYTTANGWDAMVADTDKISVKEIASQIHNLSGVAYITPSIVQTFEQWKTDVVGADEQPLIKAIKVH